MYFGISSFWNDLRSRGAVDALEEVQPARIGRFDLAREVELPPLALADGPERGGVWDVLVLADGRLAYTALAERAGWVDPDTGRGGVFAEAGPGANELAALPDGRLALTQYAEGAVLIFGAAGSLAERIVLPSLPGLRVAPKSLAFDPSRGDAGWLWVNTDLLEEGSGALGDDAGAETQGRHDARALDLASGVETLRISDPELQNLVFAQNGTGYLVWAEKGRLTLQILESTEEPDYRAGRHRLLAGDFQRESDFAQDVVIEPTGEVLITLWSGRVFVVDGDAPIRSVSLPRGPTGSLFYSAALRDERVCATRCGGVAVLCADLP